MRHADPNVRAVVKRYVAAGIDGLPPTVSDIARATGIPRATVANHVQSLLDYGGAKVVGYKGTARRVAFKAPTVEIPPPEPAGIESICKALEGTDGLDADQIATATGLTRPTVLRYLRRLQLAGRTVKAPGRRYSLTGAGEHVTSTPRKAAGFENLLSAWGHK